MMVNTVPKAKNEVKLVTILVIKLRIDSTESRFTAETVVSTMALPLAVSIVS